LAASTPHRVARQHHRLTQREDLPLGSTRPAVEDLLDPMVSGDQLERGRALRTEASARDGRVIVALDVGDLPVLDVNLLSAPHGAVRTDGADRLPCVAGARMQAASALRRGGVTGCTGVALPQLAEQRPRLEPTDERGHPAMVGSHSRSGNGSLSAPLAWVRWAAERECPPRRPATRSARRSPRTSGPAP